MPKQLWAPWRLEYVSQADELPGCPLCAEAAGEVEESLVVHRGQSAFALLNEYRARRREGDARALLETREQLRAASAS